MSPRRVDIRAAARRDLAERYRWLAHEAGADVAERFLLAADADFSKLARTPGLGPKIKVSSPHLKGMRKWRVGGFENVLIFYQPRKDAISIVRVIHAAQDWWALLGLSK